LPVIKSRATSRALSASWRISPSEIAGGNSVSAAALRFHLARHGPFIARPGSNTRRWSFV
jgi:hypothetical protein